MRSRPPPKRWSSRIATLPIGILASLFVCTVLYILVAGVLTGMVPAHLIDLKAPLASAFVLRGMNFVAGIVSLGAVAGLTSVLLVLLLGQSRIFYRDFARRPAAGRVQPGPSAIPHAVHPDGTHGNRGRDHGGVSANPGNRGADQYRYALRLRAGLSWRLDSAPSGARAAASLSHAA